MILRKKCKCASLPLSIIVQVGGVTWHWTGIGTSQNRLQVANRWIGCKWPIKVYKGYLYTLKKEVSFKF